jgi:transposase
VSNVLSEDKRNQVVALGRLGWSLRRIQNSTGVRRETAAGYLKAAGIAVRPPGGWGKHPPEEQPQDPAVANASGDSRKPAKPAPAKPANEVFTDPGGEAAAKPVCEASAGSGRLCEPWRAQVEQAVALGRNAMAVWQQLVDQHGYKGSYQSVRRFVRGLEGGKAVEARAVIETEPGEEAQVDYGSGPMVLDPRSGKHRRTRLFVMTLGFSRKCVRLLSFESSSRVWCELHEQAFRRLGGATKVLVLDNLGEGVLKPDIWDPEVNPLYRDMLAHYGAVALPCRVRDPDRKGKVESGVGHAKNTALKGLKFESMEAAQCHLDHWEQRWADTRIHGTTKRQVSAMFAEEKPLLRALPLEPFRYYQHGERTVHLDGCVEVEAAYYGAPPGWIGRKVHVQFDGARVRLLDPKTGRLLREHLRQERGRHRIEPEDRPRHALPGAALLLARAGKAGPSTGELCSVLHQRDGQTAIRRIQGILGLAGRHGSARVEEACAVALEAGVCEYRFVRRWLERIAQAQPGLKQVGDLIRQLTVYRDLIEERTKPQS